LISFYFAAIRCPDADVVKLNQIRDILMKLKRRDAFTAAGLLPYTTITR
jgi:hypothetical protein